MGTVMRPVYEEIEGFRLTSDYKKETVQQALRFIPEPGDIFLVTYPKCGTHWVSQIIQLLLHNGVSADNFFQALSWSPIPELLGTGILQDVPRPRFMKTHFPFSRLNFSKDAKYVYVARNPWDCCVSFYHHTATFPMYKFEGGSFDDYFELFVSGGTDHGDYFDHLLSAYALKDKPNVFFLTYEDLSKDTASSIVKLAQFLGEEYAKCLKDTSMLKQVLDKSTVRYMKEKFEISEESFKQALEEYDLPREVWEHCGNLLRRKGENAKLGFVRNGDVGACKSYFSPEQWQRLWEKLKERSKGTDLMGLWDYQELGRARSEDVTAAELTPIPNEQLHKAEVS